MQRLFSTFADGWPGGGLLLLRLQTGGALVYWGVASIIVEPHLAFAAPQILGAAAGVFLIAGLFTPIAGGMVTIVEVWVAFSSSNLWLSLMFAVLGTSLAMIGPGAWSVDARLFGRRQIKPDL